MKRTFAASTLVLLSLTALPLAPAAAPYDEILFKDLVWRNIGPFRGGRAVTATGVPSQPLTFYMGTTGGGVWKTEDGGLTWRNVSDGFMKTGSVGSITVALSDPNVVYAGMGEADVRVETTTHGDGVYRSNDAGKTWVHLGLEETLHIARVRVHPANPDLVYVAAQGSQWRDDPHRGVYRSSDGGQSWEKILYVDERTGASDLSIDPTNPRVLYASLWEHRRKPWHGYQMTSGGPDSGLYKSTDGGDTWEELTGKGGLPAEVGKIGVAVSPADSDRVYAVVEAERAGIYRSDDAGQTWHRVNAEHVMTERVSYYADIYPDPLDPETVYVTNAPLLKSIDGGKTFTRIRVRHGDNHELWIHPENSQWMIGTNDGGASVTYDGGKTWSTQDNQPTAQFYRVITDDLFPYNVYGGQQDNTTVKIASQSMGPFIDEKDWWAVGGGESAHVAFDPDDPRWVYAGVYQGQITEFDVSTGTARNIMYYPMRTGFREVEHYPVRFAWNAPIVASVHDPSVIYHAGNVLLKTTDRGVSWEIISPDLTRDEKQYHGRVEGPFTTDGVGGGTYNTIFYIAESPHERGTIYAGTDDGRVHLTRDEGKTWTDVTPPGIDRPQINQIEVSPHDAATAYVAATNYKFGDFTPLVFKTEDYGKTWTSIVAGIEPDDFARVVREDSERKDLLYLGTEGGLYVSFDGGGAWQKLALNLPVVPITDLRVHAGDLVAATQGRGFWILDDLAPLRQMSETVAEAEAHLFAPRAAVRIDGRRRSFVNPYGAGENPPEGAIIYYSLGRQPEGPVRIEILGAGDELLRAVSSENRRDEVPAEAGLNRYVWDLRMEDVSVPEKDLDTYFGPKAARVIPGTYKVRLTVGDVTQTETLEVRGDPRLERSPASWTKLQDFTARVRESVEDLYASIHLMRQVRAQLESVMNLVKEGETADAARDLAAKIDAWENRIVQTQQEFPQERPDPLHQPDRLDFDLLWILTDADRTGPPLGSGHPRRFEDLEAEWAERRKEMDGILDGVREFNQGAVQRTFPPITIPEKTESRSPTPLGAR